MSAPALPGHGSGRFGASMEGRAVEMVRLASIGLGWWGNVLAEKAKQAGAEIVTAYARGASGREDFARKHACAQAETYTEVLADPTVDGVLIATPHSTHAGYILEAAAAGKHVFVEKPLTLTVKDAKRCIAAMAEAGKVLAVGHNRRRQPIMRHIKDRITAGELGTVVMIETNQSISNALRFAPGYWRADREESPLGGMTSLGVHMIDTMTYLLGPIERVFASTKVLLDDPPIDDVTMVVVEFASGPLGYLGTSFVVPRATTLTVRGTGGAVFSKEDGTRMLTQDIGDQAPTEQPVEQLDTVVAELDEFIRSIRGETQPETGGAEGLEVVAVMEAMVASSLSGTAQAVADFR